jgi:hypothetical protein
MERSGNFNDNINKWALSKASEYHGNQQISKPVVFT